MSLKNDFRVMDIPLRIGQRLVAKYHYAHGGSNTATYMHGLIGTETLKVCGVAWWIPPTKSAAAATYPDYWQGVLCLSRLVIVPGIPKNACTFLLSRSRKLIDRGKWPCLVTYADQWRGHTGAIYRADNWTYCGLTNPEPTYVLNGRMVARKAGPHARTRAEMEHLGAQMIGRFAKHKFMRLN